MAASYDAIVIGLGGVGSAALYHLAARGLRVLGLEQFEPLHDRGSSHGRTRVIRLAYFEHPDYVPLLKRAWKLWEDLEAESGAALLERVGLLEVGPADGVVVPGVVASARQHALEIERLTTDDCRERFPGFVIPADCEAVFEPVAGYLHVEQCVRAHLDAAARGGAEMVARRPVVSWRADGAGVVVRTADEQYRAARLIVTAGAWAGAIMQTLGALLEVRLKHVHWFANRSSYYQRRQGCPTFLYELPEGIYYGFPQIDDEGVKIARHDGGDILASPWQRTRDDDRSLRAGTVAFLRAHLPQLSRRLLRHETCLYTMTPDGHLIVDRHPRQPQVVFAAGLSGHGFKLVPVLGELLAQLAVDEAVSLPIDFLRLDRPTLA